MEAAGSIRKKKRTAGQRGKREEEKFKNKDV